MLDALAIYGTPSRLTIFSFWSRCKRIDIASSMMIVGTMGLFGLHARYFGPGYTGHIQDPATTRRYSMVFNVKFHGRSVDVFFFAMWRLMPDTFYHLKTAGDYASDDTSGLKSAKLNIGKVTVKT
ncbi:uncharacterized protein ARMOST_21825 [Armillaria ostoyae]|uniref:Uncharacterized protein n=1 Tax=Armillaria ostoyae TaxID=47428 RepID=A0A284SB94_ARMOS|nr:uncharacterized protein ARMOST_21825 [Armillaria ostoyae]